MAGSSLLGIGSSGLQAFQRSLTTIGHNIANVNTEGYSKQSVELNTRLPQINGYGFSGSGVQVTSIVRSYNDFIEANVRSSTSAAAEFQTFHTLATQIDNVVADPDTGVATSIQQFFNAMQDVADTPSSTASREVLLNKSQFLVEQFNELSSWLSGVRNQVNGDIRGSISEINTISSAVAKLNESIVVSQGRSGGQPVNDLLDQRDALIRDLSELVSVTTVKQEDGAINVMAGSGQMLVVGSRSATLESYIIASDPNLLGVAIRGSGDVLVPMTEQLSGGRLGGILNFRDNMLDPASNSLGLTAISIGQFMNQQQNQGMDLDGALGIDMFTIAQPKSLTLVGSPGNVSVAFDDIGQLTNNDYTMRFNSGSWQLTRNDTNQLVTMTGSGTAIDPFIADGLRFEISTPPSAGDAYLIQPTRTGATDMQMLLANNRQIAAAAPIRSLSAATNTGTGEISSGVVSDIDNSVFQSTAGQLSPPVMLRFSSGTSYDLYDNTNPAVPVLLEAGISYDPATGGDVFPTPGVIDHGYSMRVTGIPDAGDEFSSEYNTGGIGDNRNVLLMSAVLNTKSMSNGSASIHDSYNALVADVGTATKQAELNSLSQGRVQQHAVAARDSVSGVNLDEEAANLVRYQQAYQASAQVIAVASALFDTLLNSIRR